MPISKNNWRRWLAWSGWVLALALAVWGRAVFPALFGWIRANAFDICAYALAAMGLFMAIAPKTAASIEESPTRLRIAGIAIASTALTGLYFGSNDRAESKSQIETLLRATTAQATTQDVQNLRSQINQLRSETTSALESLVGAINSLAPRIGKGTPPIQKPPPVSQAPSIPAEPPIALGPSLVQHIQVSQQRTTSTRDDVPFALQVILQTDQPSEPTAFMIECNGEIESGRFFVAGQPALMGVAFGVQPDKRRYFLKFDYPIFKPETPIVVTLTSRTDIRVIGVNRTNELPR